MCLTRVIQNAPVVTLQTLLDTITDKILEMFMNSNTKCTSQLLESLISLILAVENEFEPYATLFLPHLLECIAMPDWLTRKLSIDVIYTLGAILREVLIPYK